MYTKQAMTAATFLAAGCISLTQKSIVATQMLKFVFDLLHV